MDRIQIARELQSVALVRAATQGPRYRGIMHGSEQVVVHAVGNAQQRFTTDRFEQRLKGIDKDQHAEQADQRRHAAAGQHGIVDQHHVARPGEYQDVEQQAGDTNQDQIPAVTSQEEFEKLPVHVSMLHALRCG